jgi:hypothetical protein
MPEPDMTDVPTTDGSEEPLSTVPEPDMTIAPSDEIDTTDAPNVSEPPETPDEITPTMVGTPEDSMAETEPSFGAGAGPGSSDLSLSDADDACSTESPCGLCQGKYREKRTTWKPCQPVPLSLAFSCNS